MATHDQDTAGRAASGALPAVATPLANGPECSPLIHPDSIPAATIIHPDSIEPCIIQPTGSAIWSQRGKDVARFWERFHAGAQKALAGDVTNRVVNNRIFGNTGRIKLQIWGIDEWRFVFGRDKSGGGGGEGSGDGDGDGDGSGDNNKGGKGGGGSHNIEIELSEEAIDEILFRGLKLPQMLKKRAGETEVLGHHLSGLGPSGSRSELSAKDTMRNRFKRAIALGQIMPHLLVGSRTNVPTLAMVPVTKRDKRYWQFEEIRQPREQAVLFAVCDRSGSMNKDLLDLAYYYFHLKFRFLNKMYKNVVVIMMAHGSDKVVVCANEHAFRNAEVDGGTGFQKVFAELLAICRGERPDVKQGGFPSNAWNIYVDQATDGDAYESKDIIRNRYREMLDYGVNFISYIETHGSSGSSWDGGGQALESLEDRYSQNVGMARVHNRPTVLQAFQALLSKDADRK